MSRDHPARARALLEDLAGAAQRTSAGVPGDVLHAARRCLVDWIGVALGGMRQDAPARLARSLGVEPGFGAAKAPAMLDALLLGTFGHVLDFDDTDSINLVHASASVVPALVVTARRHEVPGDRLLHALVAGYELESRLAVHLGRPLTDRGWHVSGVLGPFGAATAATVATGEAQDTIAQALAIAATGSSGLIAAFGTMSKSLQLGRTAAGGVLAADLARQGFNGPVTAFDGGHAFAWPYVGDRTLDFAAAVEAFGKPYAIVANSFKPYASCMITHPSIDAARQARASMLEAGAHIDDIVSITCRVNPLVPHVAGIARPASGLQGKFSVAYCVATALLDGRADADCFSDEAAKRERIAWLLDRIVIDVQPDVGEKQAGITIALTRGPGIVARIEMARGHPGNPMSDDELGAKFLSLATPSLGASAERILADLWRFDEQPDAGAWLARHLDAVGATRAP